MKNWEQVYMYPHSPLQMFVLMWNHIFCAPNATTLFFYYIRTRYRAFYIYYGNMQMARWREKGHERPALVKAHQYKLQILDEDHSEQNIPPPLSEGLRMLVKCGERVGTKILKVLNMRMCKINDEVRGF